MKYITILDFSTGITHIFPLLGDKSDDFEEITEAIEVEYGLIFREKECQWMVGELKLQIH
jgi:hypothetical protein